MSRAYRIRVRESLKRVVRAGDQVATQLELLAILPAEEMGALLREELLGRGFQPKGQQLVRAQDGVTVTVDPETGAVSVQTTASDEVTIEGEREGRAYTDAGPEGKRVRETLRRELRKD